MQCKPSAALASASPIGSKPSAALASASAALASASAIGAKADSKLAPNASPRQPKAPPPATGAQGHDGDASASSSAGGGWRRLQLGAAEALELRALEHVRYWQQSLDDEANAGGQQQLQQQVGLEGSDPGGSERDGSSNASGGGADGREGAKAGADAEAEEPEAARE